MYEIANVKASDIEKIVNIYNSNDRFLLNHLGVRKIDGTFIQKEIEEMKGVGFTSSVIKDDKGEIIGFCDYRLSEEVYLSLLMLDNKRKGMGLGGKIYNQIESIFKEHKSKRIRIDVVYDYKDNVLGFWKKQGFVENEKIELEWNGYKSKAIKMIKEI